MKHYPKSCVEWPGARDKNGYGRLGKVRAHRLFYEMFVGAIPRDCEVMHSCDNPACVNPAHLSVGSHAANMADMRQKGRDRANFKCVLTANDVREIRASKELLRVLAARFGCSVQAISDARRGARWRSVI